MAKDITIKNPSGTVTYYPKTVSQLVYDNSNGKTVATEINELTDDINSKPAIANSLSTDLDIADENGNVLMRLANGHIKTKNFDTSKVGVEIADSDVDFAIEDKNGYLIVKLANGHIKTKNFDSSTISIDKIKANIFNGIGSPRIYTPESIDATGLSLFASLNDLYDAYDNLATNNPQWFKRESDIGYDASNTYAMRHYTIRMQNPKITSDRAGTETNLWDDSTYKIRRLIVQCGIHANEQYSILGGYLAVKEIVESNEEWAMFIKSNFIIDVLPCSNPWGFVNGNVRTNSNDKDLNRCYFSNIQQENQNIINLIQSLKGKGLVGIIDIHNASSGFGYFVANTEYTYWNYYAKLTQYIEGALYNEFKQVCNDVFGTTRDNYFHTWTATKQGQLHQYADSQGLLGCTFEIIQGSTSSFKPKLCLLTKYVTINLIQAFGAFEGDVL